MKHAEKKLDRIPYVHNWVRNIGPDQESTTRNLVRLALSFPQKSYAAASPIIYDHIAVGLDRKTALRAAETTGKLNSRTIVREYVEAFLNYSQQRHYQGLPTYDQMVEPFRIGKGLSVPVKPLINIVESGKLVPIFSVGWASFPLNTFQRRLLATVLEDAVFSLSDFKTSPGEFICFPKMGKGPDASRRPLVWNRGDIELLSAGEMKDCLHMYAAALENAKAILQEMPEAYKRPKDQPAVDPRQFTLRFGD